MARVGAHAVVVGAGMAGLLAARVLAEFYDAVTVVERDTLSDSPAHRKGIPQSRHLHTLLSRGSQVLGELFPGLLDELAAAGAVVLDDGDFSRVYVQVGHYQFNQSHKFADPAPLTLYLASRPFLEFHIRRRVRALEQVTFLDGHDVLEPVAAAGRVTGVRIANRDNRVETALAADLVVDAMGRATRTPGFLERAGYGRPTEQRSPANWAYSSQLVRLPPNRIVERLVMVDRGARRPRVLLAAYEDDTWMMAVGRSVDHGNPPADFAEMLSVTRDFLPAAVLAGLRDAQPAADMAAFRDTASVWRRYDEMPGFPTGLLVIGDALCTLNPLHGQGMTVAALEAVALQDCLRSGGTNLAQRFFTAAAAHIGPTWARNRSRERDPVATRAQRPIRHQLTKWAMNAAQKDITVTESLVRVNNFVDSPQRLRGKTLLPRILAANLRR